jgi:hypothetical protein
MRMQRQKCVEERSAQIGDCVKLSFDKRDIPHVCVLYFHIPLSSYIFNFRSSNNYLVLLLGFRLFARNSS